MDDAAIAKLYSEGQSTSHTAALRAVFQAGRESMAKDVAVAEVAEKPVAVKTRKASKPAVKSKKKKR